MVTLSTGMLLALLITGAITTLAMLSVFANVIEHETQLHDLRIRVKDLQFEHAMYLARINNQISDDDDVDIFEIDDIIDDESAPIDEQAPALEIVPQTESDTQRSAAQESPERAAA